MEPEIARTLKRRRRTPGLSVAKFSGGVAAVRHDDYTTSSHLFQPKGFAVAADMLHVAEEEKQAVRVEVDNGKLNTLQPSRIQDQATRFRPSAQEHASGQEDNGLQCHPELQRAKIEAVHLRDLLGGSPAIFAPYAVREESQQLSHMSSAPAVGEARPPPDAAAPEVAQGPKLLKAFCYEELDYADDDEEEEDEFDVRIDDDDLCAVEQDVLPACQDQDSEDGGSQHEAKTLDIFALHPLHPSDHIWRTSCSKPAAPSPPPVLPPPPLLAALRPPPPTPAAHAAIAAQLFR